MKTFEEWLTRYRSNPEILYSAFKKYLMDNPDENFGVEVPDVDYTPDEVKLIVAMRLEIAKELKQ